MTDFFVPPGHFYSPWPNPAEVEAAMARVDFGTTLAGMKIDDAAMTATWNELLPHMRLAPFPEQKIERFRYYYQNDFYSFGDALVYFGFMASARPRRIVEIGSGFSSALALDAREHLKLETDLIFIEPEPIILRSLLRPNDEEGVTIIQRKVQDVPLDMFRDLEPGDILFIDSSHVAKTGSDVCHELFEIIPILKPGVLIHFHDIFFPFEYPPQWTSKEKRAWNEIYFLRAFLMFNDSFRIMFFNHYFYLRHKELVDSGGTPFGRNSGGALWLTRSAS